MRHLRTRLRRPAAHRLAVALIVALVAGTVLVLNASAVLARDDLTSAAVLVTAAVWIPLQLITAALYRRP